MPVQPLSLYATPIEESPLHPDEPIYGLAELDLQPPDMKAHHRYQLLQVLRGEGLRWVRVDMGLSSDWPSADQFRVVTNPDGDTVASVQAFADRRREDMYWQKFLAEEAAANTLISDAIHWAEERRKRLLRQSTLGPAFMKQRN